MLRTLILLFSLVTLTAAAQSEPAEAPNPFEQQLPRVVLHTSMGDITVELYEDQAPKSVENFLQYARDDYYDGTIFHRVITEFMIQGGGFDRDLEGPPVREPIENEADNGLSNERGTIAMARTNNPHSATAQFFINLVDNPRLDGGPGSWGYTVFGRLVEGLDVLDKIAAIPTGRGGPFPTDVPQAPVVINSARVVEAD